MRTSLIILWKAAYRLRASTSTPGRLPKQRDSGNSRELRCFVFKRNAQMSIVRRDAASRLALGLDEVDGGRHDLHQSRGLRPTHRYRFTFLSLLRTPVRFKSDLDVSERSDALERGSRGFPERARSYPKPRHQSHPLSDASRRIDSIAACGWTLRPCARQSADSVSSSAATLKGT